MDLHERNRLHQRRPRRRCRLVAVAAVAAAAVLGGVGGATITAAAATAAPTNSGCPFARLVAFSEQVKTQAGRRALMSSSSSSDVSENPYLEPSRLFMSVAHDAAVSFAAASSSSGPLPNPFQQAASAVAHHARDHSHGLTDDFVEAYVSAALSAHGLNFLDLAADDPVMSKRPGVQKALSLREVKSGTNSGDREDRIPSFADPETTERATKAFQKAHRRALASFQMPLFHQNSKANYSASLGNSSTGVTAPKWSPIMNITKEGTISIAQALKWPGPANATRFESNWLSEIRTRGQDIRDAFTMADNVMRAAEVVFRSLSNPVNNGLMSRLAFHECGTFDPNGPPGRKGGCNGSIRYELDWASNGGLQRFAYPFMWTGVQIMNYHFGPGTISYADGAVLIGAGGVANGGGPWVNVGYGRPDVDRADIKTGVSANTEIEKDYELPELLAEWQRFGFDAQTLCILSGAHSFGLSATSSPQGLQGTPVFSNKYYRAIEAGVGFFTSDKTLSGPETLECVQKCAVSQDYFFSQFSKYYFEMSSWGVDPKVLKGLTKRG